MRNFLNAQRRWWWIAALVSLVVLAACVAQLPAVTPDAPAVDAATDTPATEESATEESAGKEAATEVPAEESAEEGEAVASASDGSASVAVSGEEEAATTEEAPTASLLELAGGEPVGSEETYKGLPVGFTEEGFAYRGSPDAPIVMIEYSDFGCPFCNRHFVQTEPAVDESYVRTGQVRVVFHDFPLVSLHPNAPAAHEASLCVANQESAAAYWNYHAELFRSVEEWQSAADPLPIFARLAEQTGIDMALYEACMVSGEMESVVQERVDAAFARGFSATPSFQVVRATDVAVFELIGAQPYEQFAGVVDAALAGEMPVAQAPQPEQQEEGIPFWATSEGWQPDPDRPGYNMAGDQYRGDLSAPVTVVEFSDFQCPFCQRHNVETQPTLDEKYVDTGKVLWVYKHFPLSIHPQAPAAGVASECAAEQGKFWEMHAALFASVERWSIEEPTEVFKEVAAEVGLDGDAFAACLEDPEMMERVDSDMAEGAQFVQGTPTFIIVRGVSGSIIPGALPEATFSQVLDEELAAAGATE
jgi:protein-disulfide isomerase